MRGETVERSTLTPCNLDGEAVGDGIMRRAACTLSAILLVIATVADATAAPRRPLRASLLRDIFPGPTGAAPAFAAVLNGNLLFYATDPTHGRELWRSDGTYEGTVLVRDIWPGPESGIGDGDSTLFDGFLALTASDGDGGPQLWRSDGTDSGTVLVRDFQAGVTNTWVGFLTSVGPRLWFTVQSGFGDPELRGTQDLWSSDLTPQGTSRLSEVGYWEPGFSGGAAAVTSINAFGDGALVARKDQFECCEQVALEKLDSHGMRAARLYSREMFAHLLYLSPVVPLVSGSTAYFVTGDEYGTPGCDHWRTDGTETTHLDAGEPACGLQALGIAGADLLLAQRDTHGHAQLFRATPSDTALISVADLGEGYVRNWEAITAPGGVYFFVSRGDAEELWYVDGASVRPFLLRRFEGPISQRGHPYALVPSDNGVLFWVADPSASGAALWESTGAGSTTAIAIFPIGVQPGQVAESGPLVFVSAYDAERGSELWIVDRRNPPPDCGDCDGEAPVSTEELVAAVEIALENRLSLGCPFADTNDDLRVSVDEIVAAVREKVGGCGSS